MLRVVTEESCGNGQLTLHWSPRGFTVCSSHCLVLRVSLQLLRGRESRSLLQSFNLGLWVPHPHTNPFCQVLPPLLASLVAGCLVVVPTKDYQVEPCPRKCSNCFLSHMFGKPAVTLIFLLPDPLLSSWQGDWDWPRVSHCGIWPSLRSKRGSLQQSDAQRL